ncbi:MAG: hypothetical protein NTX46_01390 [Chloroflexi bacterium]|nr:hypothetical protein [Chloroflexota bacterium]
MSKKFKILLVVVSAVVALAVGGGVAVMAQGDQPTQSNPLFAKVATILNITEQQLTDALKQARVQISNETIDQWLAKAVGNNAITQDEANKIEDWLAQRPDPSDKDAWKAWLALKPEISKTGYLKGLLGAPGRLRLYAYFTGASGIGTGVLMQKVAAILNIDEQALLSAFQQARAQLRDENVVEALDKAVANGKITQDEANQIQSWWAQRPAALEKLMPSAGLGGPRQGGRGNLLQQQFRNRIKSQNSQ